MAEYLKKYGKATLKSGYSICFIRPGEKRPFGKNWEETVHGPKRLASAIRRGRGDFGIGIKTKKSPGVDIDCYDSDLVEHMKQFTIDLLGETLERVGQAPKTLLVYRATKPFPKVQSTTYFDDEERRVKLEVLADGQQFVAFHIHPDTEEPYRWKDKQAPHNTPLDLLPEITEDQAIEIADEFDRQARERGWRRASKMTRAERADPSSRGDLDFDDPFITDKLVVQITADDLRAKLQMIPDVDDYEIWYHIGMALFHQFEGSEEGLILWHEWSAQSDKYDSDVLDDKWKSFNIEGKRREPITARFILKHAKLEEERIAGEELDDVREAIQDAPDLPAIRDVMDRIKKTAFDQIIREGLITELKTQIKTVSGTAMTPATIRKMIRYENPENRSTPPWLEGYVYVQQDETFFNLETQQRLSHKAFDATYARYMMTKRDRLEGNSVPEHSASSAALNRYQIPTVTNTMYLPGEEPIFNLNGLDYANYYTEKGMPDVPAKLSKLEKRMVARIERHMEHLFVHERERKLLLSFFAYIAQTGKRVNWAPIIQGVEGDGKTFFYNMMGMVLGAENVRTIPGESLTENNTAWAEGVQFCFIEEVRLHGANRFDVINKLKPYITNVMVAIRRMRVDWYQVVNTISYFLVTNHKDGMPVDKKDTRYFPMFSRWQTVQAIKAFEAANPSYYDELYEAIEKHAGAIRKWLLEYELSPEFNPKKRAPLSAAKAEMVFLNQSEEEEAFEASIEENEERLYSKVLLDSGLVSDKMAEHGGIAPYGRLLKQMLAEGGFTYLGRVKIGGDKHRLWSQKPQLFMDDSLSISHSRIRDYVAGKWSDPDEVDISDL